MEPSTTLPKRLHHVVPHPQEGCGGVVTPEVGSVVSLGESVGVFSVVEPQLAQRNSV
jgi:hypothetical protein